VAREKPAGVIVTGDLTMRARAREFAAATRWISDLGVPVSIGVGNHDLPYFNPLERAFDPYRRYRRLEQAVGNPLTVPGLAIVPLKTTARAQWRFNWSKGHVAPPNWPIALRKSTPCPVAPVSSWPATTRWSRPEPMGRPSPAMASRR
jgi:hypothetical protein